MRTLDEGERAGLLAVGRDASGYRAYSEDDCARVVFLTRMRSTGMPIRDLQRYVALVEAGEDGGEIAGTIDRRARGDVQADAHLGGDDAGDGQEHVVVADLGVDGALPTLLAAGAVAVTAPATVPEAAATPAAAVTVVVAVVVAGVAVVALTPVVRAA